MTPVRNGALLMLILVRLIQCQQRGADGLSKDIQFYQTEMFPGIWCSLQSTEATVCLTRRNSHIGMHKAHSDKVGFGTVL